MHPRDLASAPSASEDLPTTIRGAVAYVGRHPFRWLVRHWNWKAAVLSAVVRASIFFSVNLTASWDSAVHAAATELVYRAPMVGTLASFAQSFRRVQPAWHASLVMMLALPAFAHAIEFIVHSVRGTERLYQSVAASIAFSMFTGLVTYLLHRRNILIVGHGAKPFLADLLQLPRELLDLLVRRPARRLRGAGKGPPSRLDGR